jgi:hypothetical protein
MYHAMKDAVRKRKYLHGGKVDGHADYEDDNENNDTVDAVLSPGEEVIPRSHMHNLDDAIDFLEEHFEHKHNYAEGGEVSDDSVRTHAQNNPNEQGHTFKSPFHRGGMVKKK